MRKSEAIFAKGYCFKKYFIMYLIGSFFGALYEELLECLKVYLRTGHFEWSIRRGVIYGPLSPVYGFGFIMLIGIFSHFPNLSDPEIFFYGSLVGGAFEYAISFLQETFIGSTSWDYSKQFLNINGRTTIPIMIFWGLLTLIFIRWLYPLLSSWIERIPSKIGNPIVYILIVLVSLDMLISWTALARQNFRDQGKKPLTIVGKLYDKYYTDEYLHQHFPNMVRIRKKAFHVPHN